MYGQEEIGVDNLESPIVINPEVIEPPKLIEQPRMIPKLRVLKDERYWSEILDKYRPHFEAHGLTEELLGNMTEDKFAILKQKVENSQFKNVREEG